LIFEPIINNFVYYGQIIKENEILKMSLQGIGGGITETIDLAKYRDDTKLVQAWINEHGILEYNWKYNNICYPVFSFEDTFIRSEKGWRLRNGKWENHAGIDIVSKYDLRVKAGNDGIARTGFNKYLGYYIVIRGKYFTTLYAHLSLVKIKTGDPVFKGDLIGIMGTSGDSEGIHLHFEVFYRGENCNPVSTTTFRKKVEL